MTDATHGLLAASMRELNRVFNAIAQNRANLCRSQ